MDEVKPTVFISYAKEDVAYARRLNGDLARAGVDTWFDVERLLPGSNWRQAIEEAIRGCTHFAALLSTNSLNKRGYVQKELRIAFDVLEELPEGQIFILPLHIDDCSPQSRRLRDLQWVNMFPDWDLGLGRLLRALHIDPHPRAKIATIPPHMPAPTAGKTDAGQRIRHDDPLAIATCERRNRSSVDKPSPQTSPQEHDGYIQPDISDGILFGQITNSEANRRRRFPQT